MFKYLRYIIIVLFREKVNEVDKPNSWLEEVLGKIDSRFLEEYNAKYSKITGRPCVDININGKNKLISESACEAITQSLFLKSIEEIYHIIGQEKVLMGRVEAMSLEIKKLNEKLKMTKKIYYPVSRDCYEAISAELRGYE